MLFAVQPLGTGRIGRTFGPIIAFWFVAVAAPACTLGCFGRPVHRRGYRLLQRQSSEDCRRRIRRPSLGAPACNRMRRAAAFTARPSTPRTNGISFGRHQPRSLRYKPSFRAPFRILDIAPAITPLDFAPRFALFLADDFFADFFAFLAMLHLPKRMDNSGCMIRRESATRNQLFPQGGSEKKSVRLASAASRCRRRLVSSRRFHEDADIWKRGGAGRRRHGETWPDPRGCHQRSPRGTRRSRAIGWVRAGPEGADSMRQRSEL